MTTENKFDSLWKDFNLLTYALLGDIKIIIAQIEKQDSQTWRRLYVKSMVSILETQSSFLKNHIKITGEIDYLGLSDDEKMLLNGKTKKSPFIKGLICSVELFSSVNYSFIKVDKTSSDYKDLAELIKIRNRITHPKIFSDIEIGDIEIRRCQAGFNAFQDLLNKVMEKSAKALLQTANGLRKSIDRIKKSS